MDLERLEQRSLMDGLPVVTVGLPDRLASEEGEGQGVFVLRRTGSVEQPLLVRFQLQGSAENGADYLGLAEVATIPAGRRAVRLPIVPIDDLSVEGNEFVRLELSPSGNGSYALDNSASVNRARTVTIQDDDRLPVVSVLARDRMATEADETTGRFNIRRSGPTELSLRVSLVVSGTATPGDDYAPIANFVLFSPGQSVASIIITPYEDNEFEGDENIRVTLQEGNNYELEDRFDLVTTSVTIGDKPLVSIWVEDPVASSYPGDTGVIWLRRTGKINRELDVFWQNKGNAREDIEFASLSNIFTFEPGQRELKIEIVGRGVRFSGAKTVNIELQPNRRYNLDTTYPARQYGLVRVVDDGGPVDF